MREFFQDVSISAFDYLFFAVISLSFWNTCTDTKDDKIERLENKIEILENELNH